MSLPTGAPADPLPVEADFDVTIIGAGPVGLFAAFYAGLRTMSVKLIDSLDEPGGQLAALYPDKYIYDVAGFPKVKSRDLVNDLVAQGMQYGGLRRSAGRHARRGITSFSSKVSRRR